MDERRTAAATALPRPALLGRVCLQLDGRRHREAEGPADALHVQLLDVEDGLEAVRVVGVHVGAERLLGRLVQEVVLGDQTLQL